MTHEVSLRDVLESDLPIFFEQQCDPAANRMARFSARSYDAFMAYWAKCLADQSTILKAIEFEGHVAGNVVCWEQDSQHNIGYWLGKEYWGQGIASAALALFLQHVKVRPLFAHVAQSNAASIRVLDKCGFKICREETFVDSDDEQGEEFILALEFSQSREAAT